MLADKTTSIILIIAEIICISLILVIKNKIRKSQLKEAFLFLTSMMVIICTGVTLQNILSKPLNIEPIYFEYITYIGNVFLPVGFLLVSLIFSNTKITSKKISAFFIVPIISLIILWTNDLHHLFYKEYSINLSESISGPYMTSIYIIYTYALFAISVINLLNYSIKNAGFFSKQSILIILGALVPIVINILGGLNIITMTIYVTPICFIFTLICYAISIFKFKFLSVTPIAMRRIVDRISDSFIVINEDKIITDFNNTFLKSFNLKAEDIRNKNFVEFINSTKLNIDEDSIKIILDMCKITEETISVKQELPINDNYFNIEACGIFTKNSFLGTLILLKDVTQHMQDMKTIQNNQNILIERERLASLGQMIGGIAHNLKTPIFSVAGGLEGLSDLIKEFDESIEDDSVTDKDMHDIAKDMNEWIEKLKKHINYMSEVIVTVKGQAVKMSDDKNMIFTISELFQHVNILMQHELKEKIATLTINNETTDEITINGNINSLVQVINNLISNAIEAYNSEKVNKIVELTAIYDNKSKCIIISIKDYGSGLPDSVKEKLFKEMITTKGKNRYWFRSFYILFKHKSSF